VTAAARVAGAQAVQRAAQIIITVAEAPGPLRVKDVSARCGLPRATVSRMLTALDHAGVVDRTPAGRFVLSARLTPPQGDRHAAP